MKRALVLCALLALPVCGETRFGRQVLTAAGPTRYEFTELNDLKVPALRNERYTVHCLLYRDAERDYVEVRIRNRSAADVALGRDFIAVTEAGQAVARLDTRKEAKRIETEGSRPFEPKPSGVDPRTQKPVYERALVDQQAQEHLDRQERESVFASLLLALEQNDRALSPNETRHIACAFGPRKSRAEEAVVMVKIGSDEFRFEFREEGRAATGAQPPESN